MQKYTMTTDILIIGAGIVGLATAYELRRRFPHLHLTVVEKEARPAVHQTGHNSGVIHAGVYYAPGSRKAQLCLAGNAATRAFCDEHAIPYDNCGKLLVATNADELARMKALFERSAQNGLERHWWSAEELAEREPNITGVAAFFVPSTGIVSYRQICEKMAELLAKDGMDIRFSHDVTAISEHADGITVQAGEQEIHARYLIACAGLHADRIAALSGLAPDFRICPFRGEYYQLPAKHNAIVKHLIYPIPDPGVPFLGVHLTRMIDGSVTVGPSAVLAMAREGYRKRDINPRELLAMLAYPGIRKVLRANWKHGLKEQKNAWWKRGYLREVQKYCPQITLADLQPYPAGVRAQAVSHDGKLVEDFHWLRSARSLHVCNAPSPAATSAIPIGREIVAQIAEDLQGL